MTAESRPIEERLREVLREAPMALSAAYLFGSQARNDASRISDVDVAVLFAAGNQRTLVGPLSNLTGYLERVLGRPVDLVDLQTASPDLVHRILRDGELVLDNDPDERVEFEVRARNEYFDLAPHLERYRKYRAA